MNTLRQRFRRALIVCGAVVAVPCPAGAQPVPSADAIRGKRAEVFSRPEFRSSEPGPGNWLWRQLRDFFAWLGGLYDGSPILFWLILIGCLLALAALIALMVYQIRTAFAGGPARAAPHERDAQRLRLSVAHREESDRRAAVGDYTEAVRFLFLALVYRLDERGRVSFHKDYTNREYLDLVGERLHVRDALRVLVDTLDDHWYAQRPCDRAQYEACLAVYNRLASA
jgi:hypothetical protein